MKVSGNATWSTEGAAQYVTDTESLRQLRRRIDAGRPEDWKERPLQVVLLVAARDYQPISVRYVTHHWLARQK